MSQQIRESRPIAVQDVSEATSSDGNVTIPIALITPGWGSSGYYSPQVLENAAGARVWPSGTHMYLDHPSGSEMFDRPERSVRDLAAVFESDAAWDGQQLVADVKIFDTYRPLFTDRAFTEAIGVSIRATADSTVGEAEGRKGKIVTELLEGISVDFVTKAGRGGRILTELMESARPEQVVERAIAHGVAEATANDTREALQDALTTAYGGERSWVWVRDFDDSTVWYQHETPDETGTYAEDYTIDDQLAVTLAGDRQEVRARTEYVPAATESADVEDDGTESVDESTTPDASLEGDVVDTTDPAAPVADAAEAANPSEEDTMSVPTGAGGAAPSNPRQVMEARLNEQTRQIAEMRAENRARDIVAEVLASGWIGEAQRARLASQLVQNVPLTDTLDLDEQTLRTRATEALESAETEAAEVLSAAGVGTPRGLGALTSPATEAAKAQTSADLAESLKGAFGMSDAATQTAVKGR